MNRLDQAWVVYINALTQVVEAAVAEGKTDAEILKTILSTKAEHHIKELIKNARLYVKVNSPK